MPIALKYPDLPFPVNCIDINDDKHDYPGDDQPDRTNQRSDRIEAGDYTYPYIPP